MIMTYIPMGAVSINTAIHYKHDVPNNTPLHAL